MVLICDSLMTKECPLLHSGFHIPSNQHLITIVSVQSVDKHLKNIFHLKNKSKTALLSIKGDLHGYSHLFVAFD